MKNIAELPIIYIIAILIVFVLISIVISDIAHILARRYIYNNAQCLFDANLPATTNLQNLGNYLINEMQNYYDSIQSLGLNKHHKCSANIVQSAADNPLKYLIKYSNIEHTPDALQHADYCYQYLLNYEKFEAEKKNFSLQLASQIPRWVNYLLSSSFMVFAICNIDKSLLAFTYSRFIFSYVSPAGRSSDQYKIYITSDLLRDIIAELSAKASKSAHMRAQRSAMTSDLRNAIKKRDNYTCCICGNNVLNEPNLLLEVDHIVPISKGGKTEESNLQTLCWRCNREKGNSL